jgi:RNA polymerase sigma-70 factor (ECF subfamily)
MSVAAIPFPNMAGYIDSEDQMLLERCRHRDEEACQQIFNKHQQKVFNIAYRILRDRALAEDALQETFLNMFKGLRHFRGDSKISTWINRIAVNVCLGLIRKNKRVPSIELDGMPENFQQNLESSSPGPFDNCSDHEERYRVQNSLNSISEKHSAVVRMHDLEGHTITEIADHLDVPAGTVKSRLFYGRKEFKDHFCHKLNPNCFN